MLLFYNLTYRPNSEGTENKTSDNVPMEDDIEWPLSEETRTQTTYTDDLIPIGSSTRPMRKATIIARNKIKEWLSPEETMFVWGVSRTANND